MPTAFQLRFPESELPMYANRYDYPEGDRLNKYYGVGEVQRFLTREQFLEMVEWKSKRRLGLAMANTPDVVEEQTRRAFAADSLAERMRILTTLSGVWYPVASVLLHFGADSTEPILDRRALWSLGYARPPRQYTLTFWQAYVHHCRELAKRNGLTVRDVDKALWSYSRQYQPKGARSAGCRCI